MEKIDYEFIKAVEDVYGLQPKILELGSRIIGTQGDLSVRKIFGSKSNKQDYVGIDYIEGEGVDLVSNVQDINLPDHGFDSIVAMNLLEHVEKFWLVMDEMKRLVSENGVIVCSTPFSYDVHGCPYDYYRFTPSFYEMQFRAFKYRVHVVVGSKLRPKLVYAIASNDSRLEDRFDAFRARLTDMHRKLVPMNKVITYKLRSLLCGNHFKDTLSHFGDINIQLLVGDMPAPDWI